jgi:hypothetical protein
MIWGLDRSLNHHRRACHAILGRETIQRFTLTARGVTGRSSGGAGHALGSRLVEVRVCFALEIHVDNSLPDDLRSQIRILARE